MRKNLVLETKKCFRLHFTFWKVCVPEFHWRHNCSAVVPFIRKELENKNHAEERNQIDVAGKTTMSFSQMAVRAVRGTGTEEGGRSDKINGEEYRGLLWEVESLKYLLGSLSPSQPHHCLLLGFVSMTHSPAHLEMWRWFGCFNTREHGQMMAYKAAGTDSKTSGEMENDCIRSMIMVHNQWSNEARVLHDQKVMLCTNHD